MMNDLLNELPTKRIKAADGMAVTAQVWDEAHEYHRQWHQAHELLSHGPRIVTGLEVIASDPADSSVYVMPGIATDPRGRTIVVSEPVAYDVGPAQGMLYLLLTYEESQPTADADQEDGPRYLHSQFGIQATRALPDTPFVELCRIRRQSRESALVNARNRLHPGFNEIDLRFRREAKVPPQESACLAVGYTGGSTDDRHSRGLDRVAQMLRRSGQQVWVDNRVALAPGLETYTLLYLVGQDAFQLNRDEMNALYAFLQSGGTLFIESCRHRTSSGEPPADASFLDLLASMGVQLREVSPNHRILTEPHLFAAPPPGFETEGAPKLLLGDNIILSDCDYGCLWQGERRGRPASREEIRTALEWGENLVRFALARREGE